MNIGDKLHGFTVTEVRRLAEIDAEMVRMTYDRNGADLVWLDRPDDNKTFAITFKTIPSDDTGVFHILEHSVLCGSEKYPVKEPFVELLKGSLQTFLNAMTFPDKTMYPVSSRNDKDFLNLIDVYMDAVLHPLSISDPHAFRQEGWHYEPDGPDGELICNGVVYNEMKGAFAAQDEILQYEMNRQLFPDNCYGCESGGHPDHIIELTYDDYLDNHRRYYHPSNSRIFLDGQVDMEAVLSKLDSFLSDYDRLDVDADIQFQQPVSPERVVKPYEVSEEGDEGLLLAKGWVYGDYTDKEKSYALTILSEVLTGSNEAPLTKAILDRGLAVDVDMQVLDGIQQPYIAVVLRDTPVGSEADARAAVSEVLERISREGLDHKMIKASINKLEFLTREKDFGTMPRGLVYAITALETWLYGGDPADNLMSGDLFERLRDGVDNGYFEQLIKECLIDNPHTAEVTLTPSRTLGPEKLAAEKSRLAEIKASCDDETLKRITSEFNTLRAKQAENDDPEALAGLPRLDLSDVPVRIEEPPFEVINLGGTDILHTDINTEGLIYLGLYFDISDFSVSEIQQAAVLAKLLGDIRTSNYDVTGLQTEIDANLGRFSASVSTMAKLGVIDSATPYLSLSVSLLESRKDEAVRLIREVLRESVYDDAGYIYNEVKQSRVGMEQSIVNAGNSYARMRVASGFTVYGALTEAVYGIDMLRYLRDTESVLSSDGDEYCRGLKGLAERLFNRGRVTVEVTGPLDKDWVSEVIGTLGDAPSGNKVSYTVNGRAAGEGFKAPSQVSFTAKGGNLYAIGEGYTGADSVAATALTYGYLWNTIRVQGGAYGTGLRMALNGEAAFSSYRDPSGDRSIDSFDGASNALRELCREGGSIDNYIISTIGGQDPLLTPRMKGKQQVMYYFLGQTLEEREAIRAEVLHTDAEALLKVADKLDAITAGAAVCVIGSQDIIASCGERLGSVQNL